VRINKHISILLAMLILVSNVGLAFNVHYCEGKIASVSFNYKAEEPCVEKKIEVEKACCAKSNTHDDCCSNSKVDIKKTTSDNIIVKNFQLDLGVFTFVDAWKPSHFIAQNGVVVSNENPSFYCDSHAPPLYKLYSQYIFYA